jgi:hypothetical protein
MPLSWASSIQSTLTHPTSPRYILILSDQLRLGLPSGLFPSVFPANTLYAFLFYPMCVTWPDYLIVLVLIILIILGEEYKSHSSSLCSFLHSPVTSSLFGPNIQVFRQQTRRQEVLDWIEASITAIQSPLKFLPTQILTFTVALKYLNCDTFLKDLFAIFISRFRPTFWWRDSNIYLVFSTVISTSTSLLASIKVSVFFFLVSVTNQ